MFFQIQQFVSIKEKVVFKIRSFFITAMDQGESRV